MNQRLAHITLLVDDYDMAIKFYVEKLNFRLVEDTLLNEALGISCSNGFR